MMAIVLGCSLGLGAFLVISAWLWPAERRSVERNWKRVAEFRDQMALAGMETIPVPVFVAVSLVLAIAVAAMIFAVVPVTMLAGVGGLATLIAPFIIVSGRARRNRKAHSVVWPDLVDHLVSAVRAGLSLPDSLATLATSGPEFAQNAFAEFESDFRVTGNFSDCLDRLKHRLADPTGDRIIETLRMAREVGGSELPVVLRNFSAYLRQEAAMRLELEARQGWVVNAARLGVAAPWIILVLLATRPEAASAYNTSQGQLIIFFGLVVSLVAYRIMIAIGRLPQESRWFQ